MTRKEVRALGGRATESTFLGQVIAGKYLLQEALGQGSHGTVFRARHIDLEKDVALKILNPLVARDDDRAQRRFLREVHLATSFVHRYVVQLRDFGRDEANETLYFTMDLVEGETLADAMANDGPFDELRAIAFGTQMLESLEEAHRAGIIHRDLKPTNVLLTRGHEGVEEVRILDFGLAKAFAKTFLQGDTLTDLTMAGARVGTLSYMSPEQAMGLELDPRSDLYAVGVLMYQALTGHKPCFPRRDVDDPLQAFLFNLTTRPPEDLKKLSPKLTPRLRDVVMRSLAKKREDRFPDARAFRKALLKVLKRRPSARTGGDSGRTRRASGSHRSVTIKRRSSADHRSLRRRSSSGRNKMISRSSSGRRYSSRLLPDGILRGVEGEFINEADGSRLVWIPPGSFRMGSNRSTPRPARGVELPELLKEAPAHRVKISKGFFLGKQPVTWKQFRRFCQETGRQAPTSVKFRRLGGLDITDAHPAVNVSWKEARAYCEWATGRLPTEAEWEYAARGEAGQRFPWGEEDPSSQHCNWLGHPIYGGKATSPVGSFPRGHSAFGCLDLAGNVWEWIQDVYTGYPSEPQTDPTGPKGLGKKPRVIRGGAWDCPAEYLQATRRAALVPTSRQNWLGFRICVVGV